MAHEHAAQKGTGRQPLRSLQTTLTQETSLGIHQIGLSIENGRIARITLLPARPRNHLRDGTHLMQAIACIQKHQIITRSIAESLVHGIIETIVRFAYQSDMMRMRGACVLCHILLHHTQGAVGGASVNNEMFYTRIILTGHAGERSLKSLGSIVGDSSYGHQRFLRFRRRNRTVGCFRRRKGVIWIHIS